MIADLCVLGVVVLFIAFGYRAGLIRSCVNVATFGLSIVVSLTVYPVVASFLMKTALYDKIADFISKNYTPDTGNGILNIFSGIVEGGVAGSIAVLIINIISFVLVLILCKIALFVITRILDLFAKLPVIKQFNRLGGSVLGGVIGIGVVYLILALAVVVLPADSTGAIEKEIESSHIASQMYDNNILLSAINKGE